MYFSGLVSCACPVVIPSAEQTKRNHKQNRLLSCTVSGSVVLGNNEHRKQSDIRGGLMIAEGFRRQNKKPSKLCALACPVCCPACCLLLSRFLSLIVSRFGSCLCFCRGSFLLAPVRSCIGSGLRFLSASPWMIAAMIAAPLGDPVCSCGFLYALCAFCHCSI